MKKNKKLFVLVALFLAVFAVGGTLAYLTDTTQTTTNTFTFGKVDIELNEGNWNAQNATDLEPGATVAKQPTVTVETGSKDAFVFIEVTMPAQVNGKDVLTHDTIDTTKWTVVSTSGTTTVYAYGTSSAMTKVSANGSTPALFNTITVNNTLIGTDVTAIGNNGLDITVKAYAIQADSLASNTPSAVWTTLQGALAP